VASADRLRKLLADLNSDQFTVRENASAELAKLGESAVAGLRDALARDPSPEVARRLKVLLNKAASREVSGGLLPNLRAVAGLGQTGSSDAQQLLGRLAEGAPQARLTEEAKAALGRLVHR